MRTGGNGQVRDCFTSTAITIASVTTSASPTPAQILRLCRVATADKRAAPISEKAFSRSAATDSEVASR